MAKKNIAIIGGGASALMLACWGMKCYQDIMNTPIEQYETFTPFIC